MKLFLISTFVIFTFGPRQALSSGFEVNYFKTPSKVKLLANFQQGQNVKLYVKGSQYRICQASVNKKFTCGRTFEFDAGGQIYSIDFDETSLEESRVYPIQFTANGTVDVREKVAQKIFQNLSESSVDKVQAIEYEKETREGVDIQCLNIKFNDLQKFSCKLALSQQFLPRS